MNVKYSPLIFIMALTLLILSKLSHHGENLQKDIDLLESIISISPSPSTEQMDLNDLARREELITSYFYTNKSIESITDAVKASLIKNNIEIMQYRINSNIVHFYTTGASKDYSSFLTSYLCLQKVIGVRTFSVHTNTLKTNFISVEFQLDINSKDSPIINQEDIPKEFRTHHIENQIKEYRENESDLFSHFIYKVEQMENQAKEEVNRYEGNLKITKTEKLEYLGLVKQNKNKLTLFKDRDSGRIYKFLKDETISDWTFLGETEGGFLFKNKNIEYEVIN